MALVIEELCEGTDEAAVTTGNTGADTITGTNVFDTAFFVEGASSIRSTAAASMRWNITSGALFFVSFYIRLDVATPASNLTLTQARLSTTARSSIRLDINGTVRLINAAIANATSAITLVDDQWYRFDWTINSAGTTHSLLIFTGANLHGDTPDDTLSAAYTASNVDNIGVAAFTAGGGDVWIDRLLADNATMPAPVDEGGSWPQLGNDVQLTVAGALNWLAQTSGLSEAGAANVLAETSGLTLAGALNAYASTSGLTEAGAANVAAGTTGLTLAGALNTLARS